MSENGEIYTAGKNFTLLQQGWAGIPVPVHSQEWKPLIPFPELWEWIFSFPSRSWILGMLFCHSLPVPEIWEWLMVSRPLAFDIKLFLGLRRLLHTAGPVRTSACPCQNSGSPIYRHICLIHHQRTHETQYILKPNHPDFLSGPEKTVSHIDFSKVILSLVWKHIISFTSFRGPF